MDVIAFGGQQLDPGLGEQVARGAGTEVRLDHVEIGHGHRHASSRQTHGHVERYLGLSAAEVADQNRHP